MATPPRTSDEIRDAFLQFFQDREHTPMPGWPLVPIGDPTTMFTTAGMQQFKPIFMGEQDATTKRAATVQRCFRTGDIEDVGDLSHLTAFEMLGNFSFGDYFKGEVIPWAWEFLTEVCQIPAESLHVTIYLDDDEAYDHWRKTGVPDDRIHRCAEEHNYWYSGDTGPCGPDSEIYFDYFPERGTEGTDPPEQDDRFLEIWNLVFMQYFRHDDGSLTPLPKQNIDTGSGLERVAAVQQGKRSVYDTDIFLPILEAAAGVTDIDYFNGNPTEEQSTAIRAMAEHSRAAALLVGDGVVPSNEGRGYVLRRIIRRAVFLARQQGVSESFITTIANAAIDKLKSGYPHLDENRDFIIQALGGEEERFRRTLAAASNRLDAILERLQSESATTVPGAEAFELYDTYGLPLELTREIAGFRDFAIDDEGYNAALEAQRARARQQAKFFQGEPSAVLASLGDDHSAFMGYTHVETDSRVVAILKAGQLADTATDGEECELVLDATPFYPEGGGQMGDRGQVGSPNGTFEVTDTLPSGGAIIHRATVAAGQLRVGDSVTARVETKWRSGAARNHTATHLLHAALRDILGNHVRQQGSLVNADRLRFDFTHLEQTPREALDEVQQLVNAKVRDNLDVAWRNTTYQSAIDSGALAFFGDKYGAEVRVVEIGDTSGNFSAELCGGTHADHTGDLGFIYVMRESAVAAGTRRIEALTGVAAETHIADQQHTLLRVAERLSTSTSEVESRVAAMQDDLDKMRRQLADVQREQGASAAEALIEQATTIGEARLVCARIDVAERDGLKDIADTIRKKLAPAVVVLASVVDGRPAFLVAASPELVDSGINAGNIVREMAKVAGGGGGGRPDMAQAGAKDASKVDQALEEGRSRAIAALNDA